MICENKRLVVSVQKLREENKTLGEKVKETT